MRIGACIVVLVIGCSSTESTIPSPPADGAPDSTTFDGFAEDTYGAVVDTGVPEALCSTDARTDTAGAMCDISKLDPYTFEHNTDDAGVPLIGALCDDVAITIDGTWTELG